MERLEKTYVDREKPQDNLAQIKRYLRTAKYQGKATETLNTDCASLTVFSKWCGINFNDLTEDSIFDYFEFLDSYKFQKNGKIRSYSPTTIYTHKSVLKKFLRSIGKTELSNCIKCQNPASKKLPEDLLTKDEIEQMLNVSLNPRDSAILATFYESGARKGEISSVKLKNVEFDENGCVLTLPEGKTGARRIRLVFASSYLRHWIENHPLKSNREAPLFVSLRTPFPKYSESGLYAQLRKLAIRAGVNKRVNPHSFRHARATHLAEHLTEQQLKKYLGWTEGSNMASIYVHLSGKDIDDAILRMNGIKIDETHADGLKVGRCPRCHEINPENAIFCYKCGLPLTQDTATTIETMKTEYMQVAELDEIQEMKNELQQQREEISKLKETIKHGK